MGVKLWLSHELVAGVTWSDFIIQHDSLKLVAKGQKGQKLWEGMSDT